MLLLLPAPAEHSQLPAVPPKSFNPLLPAFAPQVKDIQRGTRVLQVLCTESKASRGAPLVARVPRAKRQVERFVFAIKAFIAGEEWWWWAARGALQGGVRGS